jgi:uncharacterized coiled-coil protein SlyX
VPDLEERVALLEIRSQEQAAQLAEIRERNADLRQDFRDVREEIRHFRDEMNRRFEVIDRRFEAIDRRFDGVERRFTWLVGMMVTGFLAVIGTVAGAFWGLLRTVQ